MEGISRAYTEFTSGADAPKTCGGIGIRKYINRIVSLVAIKFSPERATQNNPARSAGVRRTKPASPERAT